VLSVAGSATDLGRNIAEAVLASAIASSQQPAILFVVLFRY
jgi:hypothetical protein